METAGFSEFTFRCIVSKQMEEDSVFPNPFDCTTEEFVSNQLEMIKLQYNGMLKDK